MNIIDAINSGKTVKRASHSNDDWIISPDHQVILLRPEDIIAEDWIVKEKKVEITLSQLEKACKIAQLKSPWKSSEFFEIFSKTIGREIGLID